MFLKDLVESEVLGAFVVSNSRKYIGLITDIFESRHSGDCVIQWNDHTLDESSWWYWSLALSLVCPLCYENEVDVNLIYGRNHL